MEQTIKFLWRHAPKPLRKRRISAAPVVWLDALLCLPPGGLHEHGKLRGAQRALPEGFDRFRRGRSSYVPPIFLSNVVIDFHRARAFRITPVLTVPARRGNPELLARLNVEVVGVEGF